MAAPVVTLAHVGKNRIRFLIAGDGTGGTVVFTTTGLGSGAPTSIVVDTAGINGPINRIARAATLGYGQIGPGALTKAQAEGLWMDDRSGLNANPGARLVCAQPAITRQSGVGNLDPSIDADVDGSGNPIINVVIPAQAGTWYLDFFAPGTIGD